MHPNSLSQAVWMVCGTCTQELNVFSRKRIGGKGELSKQVTLDRQKMKNSLPSNNNFCLFFFLYLFICNLVSISKYIHAHIYIFFLSQFIIIELLYGVVSSIPMPSFPLFLTLDPLSGYAISFPILKPYFFFSLVQHK